MRKSMDVGAAPAALRSHKWAVQCPWETFSWVCCPYALTPSMQHRLRHYVRNTIMAKDFG